jgi:hypothetical protein
MWFESKHSFASGSFPSAEDESFIDLNLCFLLAIFYLVLVHFFYEVRS